MLRVSAGERPALPRGDVKVCGAAHTRGAGPATSASSGFHYSCRAGTSPAFALLTLYSTR